jgi:hypothetical protein
MTAKSPRYWVYVLEDRSYATFYKVGCTGLSPGIRAREEARRIRRVADVPCAATVVAKWPFATKAMACAVEAIGLEMLRKAGFLEFDTIANWFHVPSSEMGEAISLLDAAAQAAIAAEKILSA